MAVAFQDCSHFRRRESWQQGSFERGLVRVSCEAEVTLSQIHTFQPLPIPTLILSSPNSHVCLCLEAVAMKCRAAPLGVARIAFSVQLKIEDSTRRLRTGDLGINPDPSQRCPSLTGTDGLTDSLRAALATTSLRPRPLPFQNILPVH